MRTRPALLVLLMVSALLIGLSLWQHKTAYAPPRPEAPVALRPASPIPSLAVPPSTAEGDADDVAPTVIGADEAAAPAEGSLEEALRAELAMWEADGLVHAVCALEPPLAMAEGYLSVGDPEDFNGRRVIVLDGQAYLPVLEGHPQEGHLSIEGYAPRAVDWTLPEGARGACQGGAVALTPGGTVITGRVRLEGAEDGAPDAWVEGCGNMGQTDDEGVYYLEVLAGGPCTLLAMRQDGQLRSISPPQTVTPQEGQDLVVDFALPAAKRAGLGVQISPVEEGLLIKQIIPGGAAERAGIQAGDVILAVDGEAIAGMALGDVVDLLGGEAGSAVDLLLADSDNGPRELTLERAVID